LGSFFVRNLLISLPSIDGASWTIDGVLNFDHNGHSDILWRNASIGKNQIWLINDASVITTALLSDVNTPDWAIAEQTDFDQDGNSDILWYNTATSENVI